MTAVLAAAYDLLANFLADRILDLLALIGPVVFRLLGSER